MKSSLLHATKKWVIKHYNINTNKTLKLWQTYNRQNWRVLQSKWPLVISAKFYRSHLQLENRLLKQLKCISNKTLLKADMLIIFFFFGSRISSQFCKSSPTKISSFFSGLKMMHTKCCNHTQNTKHDTGGTRSSVISSYPIHFHWWVTCSLLNLPSLHRCCWFLPLTPHWIQIFHKGLVPRSRLCLLVPILEWHTTCFCWTCKKFPNTSF